MLLARGWRRLPAANAAIIILVNFWTVNQGKRSKAPLPSATQKNTRSRFKTRRHQSAKYHPIPVGRPVRDTILGAHIDKNVWLSKRPISVRIKVRTKRRRERRTANNASPNPGPNRAFPQLFSVRVPNIFNPTGLRTGIALRRVCVAIPHCVLSGPFQANAGELFAELVALSPVRALDFYHNKVQPSPRLLGNFHRKFCLLYYHRM